MFSFTYVSITTYRHCTLSPPLSFPRPLLLSSSPKSMKAHAKINVDEIFNNRKLGSGQVGVRLGTAWKKILSDEKTSWLMHKAEVTEQHRVPNRRPTVTVGMPLYVPIMSCYVVVPTTGVLESNTAEQHRCTGEQYCSTTSTYWTGRIIIFSIR